MIYTLCQYVNTTGNPKSKSAIGKGTSKYIAFFDGDSNIGQQRTDKMLSGSTSIAPSSVSTDRCIVVIVIVVSYTKLFSLYINIYIHVHICKSSS